MSLKPLAQRRQNVTDDAVIARLRGKLLKVSGSSLFLQSVQDLNVGGRQGFAQFQYSLKADDLALLKTWATKLGDALKRQPMLTDVNSDQEDHGLESYVTIDRDTAARLGLLSATDVDNNLYDAFGQRQVSTIYKERNQYHVIMEAGPGLQPGDRRRTGPALHLDQCRAPRPQPNSTAEARSAAEAADDRDQLHDHYVNLVNHDDGQLINAWRPGRDHLRRQRRAGRRRRAARRSRSPGRRPPPSRGRRQRGVAISVTPEGHGAAVGHRPATRRPPRRSRSTTPTGRPRPRSRSTWRAGDIGPATR